VRQGSLRLITPVPAISTSGTPLRKTHLLSSPNEIANGECGRPPVMCYNFWWFQPYATRVICNVWDVKTNIRIHKTNQLFVPLGGRVVIQESTEIHYIFGAGSCAVLTGEGVGLEEYRQKRAVLIQSLLNQPSERL